DNLSETILYLLYQVAGQAPMIPLDEALRPKWLFEATVHQGCDRAGYYEEGDFASEYGSAKCLVKLGCWGPVVKCNVPKRGWINGVGGCPNVGGICIACTMPGFPDKFMPFMDTSPGATVSSTASGMYGTVIRSLRGFTARTADKEPKWRVKGSELRTGYQKTWCRDDYRGRDRTHRDDLGPHHQDRRQPRHLHQDRLQGQEGGGVPQHLVDLPRLQHLHEGQGPPRRALYYQPDLRGLRG